ncbi:zinc finger protein 33B-like isoform X1 [Pectinophora gossypiella]|uniref:zinc finger protein 33B-like isoform X1 n=1 Tax=Pectinophora gossypiella TaxID=13191 RepID=UPI00214EF84D|nr:zinc finger protein 33B-like isoform X1 [Pectinophora gossypiella]
MRTYTRRRPENREIDGAEGLCRLCLEKAEDPVPLFVEDKDCSPLALRIMICVGLEMTKEDNLPNMICGPCQKELERCYSFRKKCEVSYQKLKSHLLAVKERHHAEAEKIKEKKILNVVKDEEKQNIVFTVNMDGSIQLCDSNNSLTGERLVTLMKMEQSDLSQCGDTIVLNAPLDTNEVNIQDRINAESTIPPNNNNSLLLPLNMPQATPLQPDASASQSVSGTDMARFLSTMLVELGIISKHGDNIVTVESGNKSIQIEAGDGSLISIELIEEDEQDTHELPVQFESQSNTTLNGEVNNLLDGIHKTNGVTKKLATKDAVSEKSQPWCGLCSKVFVSRGVLARHVRDVHQRQRPHACPICHKRFAQKEVLTRHQLVHDAKRPHQCPQCPKSFTQRGALASHARLHRPAEARALALYQCPHCPKVFLYASGNAQQYQCVSRHMAQHMGKVFECGTCGRQFNDKSSLHRHFKLTRHQPRPADAEPAAPPPGAGE